jgi:hypothetical protein
LEKSSDKCHFQIREQITSTNYRPVSLTSLICKTLKRIIRDHLIDHIDKNKLFSDKQYGFIKGRSTTLQLLEVLDKWTEAIDDGLEVDCIID